MSTPDGHDQAEAARAVAADHDEQLERGFIPKIKRKSRVRWAIEILLSVSVVVAIFVVVLPRVTGSSYAEVWNVLGALGPEQILLLTAVWLVNMATYTGVLTNSLPGLTHPQAFVANLSSSAVSNVLPFGGAAGVGATYLMYGSWGFTASETTRSILVSGVWNVFAKLALPVVALVMLSFTHEATIAVATVAAIGVGVLTAVDRAVLAGPAQRRLRRRRRPRCRPAPLRPHPLDPATARSPASRSDWSPSGTRAAP